MPAGTLEQIGGLEQRQAHDSRMAADNARIVGSHPAVMGLPLFETTNLLKGAGWHPAA